MLQFAFIIPPNVELLDLAGPVQVFTEAKFIGFDCELSYWQFEGSPVCTSGLGFGKLADYTKSQ